MDEETEPPRSLDSAIETLEEAVEVYDWMIKSHGSGDGMEEEIAVSLWRGSRSRLRDDVRKLRAQREGDDA